MFIRARFSPREESALSMLSKTVQVSQTHSPARGSIRRGEDSSTAGTCPTLPESPGVAPRLVASRDASAPPDPTGGFLGLSRRPSAGLPSPRIVPPPSLPQPKRQTPPRAIEATPPPAAVTPEPSPPRLPERVLVLVAANDLAARGVTVTLAALSVRCWELWPDRFGLGDTPHPDSAKVTARVADLVGAGRLVRLRLGVLGVPKALTSPRGAR